MLSANEARERTNKFIKEQIDEQLSCVEDRAIIATKQGEYETIYIGTLLDSVIVKLRGLGYTVEKKEALDQRDSESYIISW